MSSLYKHTKENPFHISVGAVVVNDKGEILVHKVFKKDAPKDQWGAFESGNRDEMYILMRETLENGEPLEEAVLRGVQEEFGIKGIVKKYLGSIQGNASTSDHEIEKTTLYFEVIPEVIGERPSDDEESYTILEWHDSDFLITHMREQGKDNVREDLDESKIIEAYVRFS